MLLVLLIQVFSVVACSKDWVANIDGDKITLDEFNLLYYTQHKLQMNKSNEEVDKLAADSNAVREIPSLNRELFLNDMISRRLVYNKADEGHA
jgi:hypothetical protein